MTKKAARRDSKPERAKIVRRVDGWGNLNTGYGTTRDKVRSHLPIAEPVLTEALLTALWDHSDLARRIVRKLPEQALRGGFTFVDEGKNAEAKDAKRLTKAMEKKWRVRQRLKEAAIWGRLYGAGFVMVGVVGAGSQRQPLDPARIPVGGLRFLSVYDKRAVTVERCYSDSLQAHYGEPELYRLQPTTMSGGELTDATSLIHASRMICIGGALTGKEEKAQNNGFDYSVLQAVFEALQQTASNWSSICALMADFGQAVVKLQGLIKLIASKGIDAIEERVMQMDIGRSSMKTLVLDAEKEEFERKSTPVAGAADLIACTWQRLATAADMPVTELMEEVPTGLSATGTEQTRKWYERISEYRDDQLTPPVEFLAAVVAASEGVVGFESLELLWPSMWQQTPSEQSKSRLENATADEKYVAMKAVTPSEIALSRWGRGKYSAETTIDLAAREEAAKKELARLGEEPKPVAAPASPAASEEAEDEPTPEPKSDQAEEPKVDHVDAISKLAAAAADGRRAGLEIDVSAQLAEHGAPVIGKVE